MDQRELGLFPSGGAGGVIERLRRQIAQWEGARRHGDPAPVSSGWKDLDQVLPRQGFARGTLVEWLSSGEGGGAGTLALATAREACRDGGALVVMDPRREFYPPAAVRAGVELGRLVVLQPQRAADGLWALDQALRCTGVSAALVWPERLDERWFRRLQLAAEEGESLGLLLRSQSALGQPSWADVRLQVEPAPTADPMAGRRLRVHVLRGRGDECQTSVELTVEHETHPLSAVSPMVTRANQRRAAGA